MTNKKIWGLGIAALVLLGAGLWGIADSWRYRHWTGDCPFADYLPDRAQVTKCDHDGLIDFSVDLAATGTRADMAAFVAGLRGALSEAWIAPVSGPALEEAGATAPVQVRLHAKGGVLVDLGWSDGVITMYYFDG